MPGGLAQLERFQKKKTKKRKTTRKPARRCGHASILSGGVVAATALRRGALKRRVSPGSSGRAATRRSASAPRETRGAVVAQAVRQKADAAGIPAAGMGPLLVGARRGRGAAAVGAVGGLDAALRTEGACPRRHRITFHPTTLCSAPCRRTALAHDRSLALFVYNGGKLCPLVQLLRIATLQIADGGAQEICLGALHRRFRGPLGRGGGGELRAERRGGSAATS